jgi:hypothetical protein
MVLPCPGLITCSAMFNASKKFFLIWGLAPLSIGVVSESLDVG